MIDGKKVTRTLRNTGGHHIGLACISHHLTAEARDRAAITSFRLLAVLNVQ